MAKKAKATKKATGPKAKPANAAPGHNTKVDRVAAKKFFDSLDALHKEKAENASTYAERIGNVYEKAANELGISQKAVKEVYADHKYELAKLKRRKEMTPEQNHDIDRLTLAASSYKTSPLFLAAEEREQRLAAAKETVANDKDEKEGAE